MKKSSRSITALALTAIYLLITLSPLAPLALHSPRLAHAITGECAGDCGICGCSLERSADHTCCCWIKKKLQHHHDDDQEQSADCCKKKQHGAKPVLTCGCPCDNGKTIALSGAERFEQLPYRFIEAALVFHEETLSSSHPFSLTNRHGEPPEPPPKLTPFA